MCLKLKMTMDIADNAQEVMGQFIRKLSGYAFGGDTPDSLLAAFRILENYYISAGSVKNGARRREKIQNRTVEQTVLSAEEIREEQVVDDPLHHGHSDMGVGVDHPRHHDIAGGIDLPVGGPVVCRADGNDPLVRHDDIAAHDAA